MWIAVQVDGNRSQQTCCEQILFLFFALQVEWSLVDGEKLRFELETHATMLTHFIVT